MDIFFAMYAGLALMSIWIAAAILIIGGTLACLCAEAGHRYSAGFLSLALLTLVICRVDPSADDTRFWVLGVASYVGLGVGWTYVKWTLLVSRTKDLYVSTKLQFISDLNLPEDFLQASSEDKYRSDAHQYRLFADRVVEAGLADAIDQVSVANIVKEVTPRVERHKVAILTWMMYWPVSALAYFMVDLVRDAFEAIYRRLRARYQAISDGAFEGVA